MLGYLYGKRFGSKIARVNRKEGDMVGAGQRETECSETSAYKIQTPGNYPEESIQVINRFNPAIFSAIF
jgi:hypothetical protein